MSYLAELVTAETRDGVRLEGSLRRPAAGAANQLGIDVMIMHHGIGGNFYRSVMFDYLSEALLAAGCAPLRVNNRGHELITSVVRNGQPSMLGAAYETVADCVHDWRAWVDFAAEQGFRNIGIWSHSLGAVKTIYYLGTEGDDRVVGAVASSPPRFAYEMYMNGPDADEFRGACVQAQALVDDGKGRALVEMTLPTRAVLSAATFVDKYGPSARYDILQHLPQIHTPMLVTVGGLEANGPQRIAFSDHEPAIGSLASTHPQLAFQLVPGADHFYTACEEALWQAVRTWAPSVRSTPAV